MPYESKDKWKERLIEEYDEVKKRYEKLNKYLNKIEVEKQIEFYEFTIKESTKEEKEARKRRYAACDFMYKQRNAMREYLHYLELRAELEGIEL